VALTVYALLRRFRPALDSIEPPEQQLRPTVAEELEQADGRRTEPLLVVSLIMRLMYPVIGALAVYLFMRGHDMPGGGFVAGLTLSIGFLLQYMVAGARWVEARLTILPVRWMGLGLAFALATGAAAWLFGHPFLTSSFTYLQAPVIGKVPLVTAIGFDLGVFMLVIGATVLILIALAHQSIRRHRPSKVAETTLEQAGGP
jgi:multicomponent K+:H+ antiporter subunit A